METTYIHEPAEVYIDYCKKLEGFLHEISRLRGKTFVVKLSGELLKKPYINYVAHDIAALKIFGNPVVVHGGGPQIDAELRKKGIRPKKTKTGTRITGDAELAVIKDVLPGLGERWAKAIEKYYGCKAFFMNGANITKAKKTDPADSEDLGYVGDVMWMDADSIKKITEEFVPVICSLASDYKDNPDSKDDRVLNVNADPFAASLASELRAEKIFYLTTVDGIPIKCGDDGDTWTRISEMTLEEAEALLPSVDGGMYQKLNACIKALEGGVRTAHIIKGEMLYALLIGTLTEGGMGTTIYKKG